MRRFTQIVFTLLILFTSGVAKVWAVGTSDIYIFSSDNGSISVGEVVTLTGGDFKVTLTAVPNSSDYTIAAKDFSVLPVDDPSQAPKRHTLGVASELEVSDESTATDRIFSFILPKKYAGAMVTAYFTNITPISISDISDIDNPSGNYKLNSGFSVSGSRTNNIGSSSNPFRGSIEGYIYDSGDNKGQIDVISLSAPLFDYVKGATIKNIVVEGTISGSGNVGAIAGNALGASRIYNCGVLATGSTVKTDDDGYTLITSCSSTISGGSYVGGIVGFLDGTSRVINCYSYANVSGGSHVGGIVGYNNVATTSAADNLKTMVMNCMFYGEVSGSSIAPIYNGEIITNDGDADGVNNFNYFRLESSYIQDNTIPKVYNCALGAETRFLQRFEFYRHLLNSNRELAAWWATGDADNKDEMMKWVLEPSQIGSSTPYPILKTPDKYASVVNYKPSDEAYDGSEANRNKGLKLTQMGGTGTDAGKLSVTIQMGSTKFSAPSSAGFKSDFNGTIKLTITDKDYDHFNFNYGKVQLPYYNDYCNGNYTGNRVVTGWKIISITGGTAGSYSTGDDVTYNDKGELTATPYNFADRKCKNKDLYSESGRVFNQGAYWDVPEGVTAITIEPYWGKAVYLSDAYWDVTYKNGTRTDKPTEAGYKDDAMTTATNVTTVGGGQHYEKGKKYNLVTRDRDDANGQIVYTSMSDAISSSALFSESVTDPTVYDYAVVLVGNYHHTAAIEANKNYTVTSIDLDGDNEPDYSLMLRFNGRLAFHPVKYDFLNLIGLGMAQKTTGGTGSYNLGIMQPKAWFEVTNTALFRVTQFEYDKGRATPKSPYILQGGVIEQWVTQQQDAGNGVSYFHIGGNVWFKEFHRGSHQDNTGKSTPHPPVSVTGGDFSKFYLTGYYQSSAKIYDDNAECYINGGRFGEIAGAGMEGIGTSDGKGNITWIIDNADIKEFYGGGINHAKPVHGNIHTIISNSHVDVFCGGPKFGNMVAGRTVTTTATNCTFGTYFGAGFGGNSYSRYAPRNHNNILNFPHNDTSAGNHDSWNAWLAANYTQNYDANKGGISTQFDYQFLPMSNNFDNVARIFVDYVAFSLATCHNVTSSLTGCTITGHFYGGGNLGKVDGNVTSTLSNCTVNGNVYGAGYSASLPPIEVMSVGFQTEPYYYEDLGTYRKGVFPTPTTTYHWQHANAISVDNINHILYTTEDLDALGTVEGKVTLNIEGENTSVTGNIYGGGQSSDVYGVNSSSVVTSEVEVNIKGGSMTDVYGGGEGQTTVVGGDVTVNIGKLKEGKTDEYEGNATVTGSVYGGSALGAVNAKKDTDWDKETNPDDFIFIDGKETKVNILKGTVNGNVYGGGLGDLASLGTDHSDVAAKVYGDVTVTVGAATETAATTVPIIEGSVYGGSNVNGVLEKGARVDIISGTIGKETTTSNTTTLSGGNVHGGGYGQPTLVKGDVTVNVGVETNETPAKHYGFATIKGDVYGGSAKGNVNAEWVTDNSTTPATETLQHAGSTETKVNLYGSQSVRDIYGGGLGELGNNPNSETDDTPANVYGNVTVKVYGGTARYVFGCNNIFGTPKGTVDVTVNGTNATTVDAQTSAKTYAIKGVYGGGNLAHYDPTTPSTYPTVTVSGCSTSIEDVFGGGNAAAVPYTNVTINGGDINRVFAGGNGSSGAANVGYKNSKVTPTVGEDEYGTGTSNATIAGGTINEIYGGSNSKGTVRASGTLSIAKPSTGTCPMKIGSVYGGGNQASGAAVALSIGCTGTTDEDTGITNVFGGANAANITGDILLNITEGKIANVYGGNNSSGSISGTITVNIEKAANPCIWNIGNVYGGGKLAPYGDADHNKGNYPVVNIKNGTVSGSVFGGGFGSTAVVYGNPQVTIGHATEGYDADVTGDVYGGGDAAAVEGTPVVHVINKDNTSIGNVYGGGNAADVSATSVTIDGGTIGLVFGGGHGDKNSDPQKAANVSGNVAVAINGGTITKVFGGSNSKGNIGGTITLGIEKSATASTMKIGEVYGGGNEADGNAGTITIGCTGTWTTEGTKNHTNHNSTDNRIGYELEGIGTVYGGANAANIGTSTAQSNISLTIGGGIIENVYGGNNTSGAISGTIDVNINKDDNATCADNWYVGNVYGGGNLAAYSGSPTVTVTNGLVSGRVFGGGNQANVGGSTVNINGGGVGQGVYGGCNTSGTIGGAVTVTVKGGTLGSSSAIEAITDKTPETLPNILFGGGKGSGTSVTGLVTLNVGEASSDNALIYGNVYGGSEEGEVSVANVNLNGNTIQGNVFGGGYRTAEGKTSATNVTVTLDGTTFDRTYDGTAQIFGANNVQGSPTGHVLVHVKNTAPVSGQTYDIAAVYGGGNNADYNPTDETQTAEVIIEGCNTTSIKNVYGGGNAAAVPGSEIWILGSKVIDNLFGGGNGEAGAAYAAHVGFHRTSATTKSNYSSGEGTTYVKLVGGTIHTVYGGSNSNGDIRGGANILMPTIDEFTASHSGMSAPDCCSTLTTTNIYGGGKNADMSGGTTVVLGCVEGLDNVYGGAMSANIKGGVNLVVTSGTFKKVFGGNDTKGTIQGPINLYIEETGCEPLVIGELYLGGNLAPYSVYGYKEITDPNDATKTIVVARSSLSDNEGAISIIGEPAADKKYSSTQWYADPQLNVTSFTSIGNVFGGGLGTSAVLYGNPTIEINEVVGRHADEVDGYPIDANQQDITALDGVSIPQHTKDAIGAIGNVYGGGNLATVYGSTKVNIGTETTVGFKTEPVHLRPSTAPTTPLTKNATTGLYDIPVDGVNITGNVYGGGNQADVTGDTQVNICAKETGTGDNKTWTSVTPGTAGVTIGENVFGGGKGIASDVTKAHVPATNIHIGNGAIKKSVYGGGELAQVEGNTNVTVMGGTIGTAKADLPSGVTMGAVYGNIYGGGFGTADATITNYKLFGLIKGDTHVTVSGGDILHNVYGGGAYGSVGDFTFDDGTTANTGMPTGRKANTTGGNTYVTITGGNIGTTGQENGMVFGSSRGDVDVLGSDGIDPNDRLAWVYDTHVTIGTLNASTGPHIYGSLYGSGENGHTWNDTEVIVHSGTIGVTTASEATNITEGGKTYSGAAYPYRGNVYGGGCGTDKYDSDNNGVKDAYNSLAGIVRGDATITITGGTIAHNVYGAGAMGSVGTMTKATNGDVTITSGGTTTIAISGGIVGVDGADGGNVFGAARGDETTEQTDVALVKTTSVTISGDNTEVKGNVYGGGQMGNVQATTTVNIQGGAIKKNVYGGGMGESSRFTCAKAMVGIEDEGAGANPGEGDNADKGTHVTISNGTVGTLASGNLVAGTGNVYGGGEIARVEWNTQVTIGSGSGTPYIYGDVFGAGKGLETHGYSALVRGNSTVIVQGNAKVGKNVYGGGEKATVGRYWVKDINNKDGNGQVIEAAKPVPDNLPSGMPYKQQSGGICRVTIQGSAEIGYNGAADNKGHVFGAGQGVEPHFSDGPQKMTADGLVAFTDETDATTQAVVKTAEQLYLEFLETLALVTNSYVTVNGGTVKGNVYGGSESGFVQHDTDVQIQGGTIGTTTYGDVFGGGKGLAAFAEAGKVKGNAKVAISGDNTNVNGNVYGGGELGDVGTIDKRDINNYKWSGYDTEVTTDDTGICTVSVAGGTVQKNVFGAGKGSGVTFQCEKAMAYNTIVSVSDGTVNGNVYGGGEVGRVENDTQVTVGRKTTETEGNGSGTPDIKGSVFGAGKGLATHGYSALVRGNTAVTVEGASGAKVGVNVYGGGEIASVGRYGLNAQEMPNILLDGGRCIVKVLGNVVIGPASASDDKGNVFGAGKGVSDPLDTDNEDKSKRSRRMTVYTNSTDFPEGSNAWEYYNENVTPKLVWEYFQDNNKYNTYLETLALATHPEVTIAGNATINSSVFGGGELGLTKGSVVVNINGGTIVKDVYGGGSLANTNTTHDVGVRDTENGGWQKVNGEYVTTPVYPTTHVSMIGGQARDLFGGGLGRIDRTNTANNVEAKVYGDVLVELNGKTTKNASNEDVTTQVADDAMGAIVNRVFGANNLNGSPQKNVTVHVYGTQNVAGKTDEDYNQIIKKQAKHTVLEEGTATTYDVLAVYGGGNEANYVPLTAWDGTSGSKTQVIIEGCARSSIKTVYGGGNAASVPETNVLVKSAYEIEQVFGGGNGKDKRASDNSDNPGADIGVYKDKNDDDVVYGTGNANTLLEGGLIHEVYGGSNQKGTIKGSLNQTTNPKDSSDPDFCCELVVDKIVGAGKYADIDGDVNMTLSCQPSAKVPLLFAGADEANVNGNITLNITNGNFGQVFGGNNLGGAVKGKITVNVQETGCQPIKIDELYLGGNEAAYSVYGYYESDETHDVTGLKILKPRTAEMHAITDPTAEGYKAPVTNPATDATHTFPYAQPELNIISCTYIGKVFGGGLGSPAKMYANPTVNVNMVPSSLYADGIPTFMNSLGLDVTKTAPNPTKIGIIGDVFGGGNAADIVGNTTVNIAVEYVVKQVFVGDNVAGYYTRSGAGTTADPFVYTAATGTALEGKTYYEKKAAQGSAYIIGSVFGGGNAADVLGNTNVTMSDGYVFNGIFGGGYAGNVGTFTRSTATQYTSDYNHTAHEGCIGKPIACAEGTGLCTVVVNGGQIGPISVATQGEGMNRKTNGKYDPVPQGWVWGAGQGLIEDPAVEKDTHFKSYVGSTDVTIGGTAFVLESIIGGGEFGRVLGDTKVTITGQCQIGVGEGKVDGNNKPIRYTDDQFVNPLTTTITNDNALVECSHFPYGEDTNNDGIKDTFLPYDPYYDDNKTYADAHDLGPASTSDPSDGKTWIGCVFAGGSGYMPYLKKDDSGNPVGYDWCSSAGLVEGNTNLTISGGHILTNVYGGNEVTNVKGKCKITMTGGTIGVPRTIDQIIAHPLTCYLFGAGKGDQRPHFNTETNVGEVEINISGGIIYGSVFGGGEDGHVQRDVDLTIEKGADFTIGSTTYTNGPIIGTWGTSYVDGNVFGGGRGFGGDAYTAGNVAGSVDVKIKGGNILGSIYGGGRLGSVGYGLYPPTAGDEYYGAMRPDNTDDDADNSPVSDFKRGYVDIEISGGTIGNRHEYIIPSEANTPTGLSFAGIATWTDANWTTWKYHNNIPLTEFDKATYRLKHTKGGNVFAGGMGRLYQLDGTTPISLVDWWKLGCVKSTKLTITGGTIKSCVYGGGELGQVVGYHTTQNAANEEINAGTEIIIQSSSTTTPTIGTEIKDGSDNTEYTFGSVFGGGYGSLQEGTINNEYPKLIAGRVKKDTKIDMKAGEVKASIYGGGEMASVGESTTSGETTTATGSTYVAVSGGTIGIAPITVGSTTRNFGGATMGNVYGGGSGHGNTVRSGKIFKNTNVAISGSNTRIYHNIYGGGAYGTVGDFDYTTNSDNKVTGVKKLLAPGTGVATITITGGTIGYDGKNNGMVFGSSRGDVNKPGERDDYSAWVYDTFVTIGTQDSETGPAIKGSVYGSGENGHTFNDTDVKVYSGTIGIHDGTDADGTRGNVYGGGCGTDKYYSTSTELFDGNGDAYNPLAGIVQGTATVTINGGHVLHNVYGAGAMGPVGVDGVGHKTTVNINGGRIGYDGNDNGNVYGGARGDQGIGRNFAYVGDTEVNINYADTPDGDNEGKTEKLIAGSVFGGGEAGSVHGGIVVNMNKGLVLNDVYGGGALADTNLGNWDEHGYVVATALNSGELITDLYTRTGAGTADSPYSYTKITDPATDINSGTYYRQQATWAHAEKSAYYQTKVNILGGTIGGDAYGGGLGQLEVKTGETVTTPAIEAKVYGDVYMNLNGFDKNEVTYDANIHGATGDGARLELSGNEYLVKDDKQGAVVSRIFGCNNLNGSPQGKVKVHVFKTQRAGQTRITNPAEGEQTAKVHVSPVGGEYDFTAYDVQAVYGGGNMAAYVPKDLTEDAKSQVIIDGCDRTSIGQVYGGGNAASTPATDVTVNGTFEIAEVFGGGNGKDAITLNGVTKANPGANVGFYDYSAEEDIYNTKDKRTTDPDLAPTFISKYVYGSGKAAVNIFGGTIHRVFGGSNTKGNVRLSAITLLEEVNDATGKPCCEFHVDEAYGGGKSAPMDAEAKLLMACIPGLSEVYGGAEAADVYDDVSVTITNGNFDRVFGGNNLSGTIRGKITVNIEETGCKPVIIGELYGGGNQAGYSVYGYNDDGTIIESGEKPLYADPQVNVRSFTSIGTIYGGGYGKGAKMVANPTVNINESVGSPTTYPSTGDYDDNGFKGKTITVDGHDVTLPSHTKGKIGAINNVFGGGNAAKVIGNTNVNIGTEDTQTYVSIDDDPATTEAKENVKTVVGADIRGNVYGGGNNAEVTGNTNVQIGQKK